MRLTSDFFISSLMRRVFADGGFAAVERKGAEAAGAIYIRQRKRFGLENLFAPAPQALFGAESATRLFELRLADAEASAVDAMLARETRFDPDLWIVEIEAEDLSTYLDIHSDL